MHTTQDQTSTNILLIGEDERSCKLVSFVLAEEGLNVYTANNPQAALAVITRRDISLAILDCEAPTESDVHLSREMREIRRDLSTMLLVNAGNRVETLLATQCFDDYVVKPYSYTELVARVRTALRRSAREAQTDRVVMNVAGLELDVSSLTAVLPNGKKIILSPTEMKVLRCLMSRPGKVISREKLSESVWGSGCGDDSYVRVCISRVRRKLGEHDGEGYIEAVRGAGYRLSVRDSRQPGI
ncbi:MAG: response regulator transcription factor [Chloroflexi bacterium]|nr:response regulator transcription factor [Chloroflexota bacterium]